MKTILQPPPKIVCRDLFKAIGIVGIFEQRWHRLPNMDWPRHQMLIVCPACSPRLTFAWPPKITEDDTFCQVEMRAMRFIFTRRRDAIMLSFWAGMCQRCDAAYWFRHNTYSVVLRTGEPMQWPVHA